MVYYLVIEQSATLCTCPKFYRNLLLESPIFAVYVYYTIANNDSLKFYDNAFDFRGLSVL